MTGGVLDLSEVRSLASRIGDIPRDFQREVRPALRGVGQDMLRDAQANSSWSSRIPGSIQLRVSLNGARPGVALRASVGSAPHARVYEGILGNSFRHPLFGDREIWYAQAARPYLLPAVQAANEALVEEITRVVDAVHRKTGLI